MEMPFWITVEKKQGGEWEYLRKIIAVSRKPDFAEVLFTSTGVCALYVNGRFVESAASRWPDRTNRHEITGYLKKGENVISLHLGSFYFQNQKEALADYYFQKKIKADYQKKGRLFSRVALQVNTFTGRKKSTFITDRSWKSSPLPKAGWQKPAFNDQNWPTARETGRVTGEEYACFWSSAALWKNLSSPAKIAPKSIVKIVKAKLPEKEAGAPDYINPVHIKPSDLKLKQQPYQKGNITLAGKENSAIFDFGRLVVGYLAIGFAAGTTGQLRCEFDYSESCADFTDYAPCGRKLIEKLAIETQLAGKKDWFNVRRRAFRYVKITVSGNYGPVVIDNVDLKPSMYPALQTGWFNSSDPLLNKIWQVSRYTLQVNMHQEYESCPRHEMLFFSGDGRIDGLVDYYLFGDGSLMKSSLSQKQPSDAGGYVEDVHQEKELWDYPAWHIICLSEHYLYKKDADFVKQQYPPALKIIDWYLEKTDSELLICQRPIKTGFGINEWTCSKNRLGYKTSLNCLWYKILLEISFLSRVVGKNEHAIRFAKLAEKVKQSINRKLWSEEKSAYVDSLYQYTPQDGNVLAVIFGVADEEKTGKILSLLKLKFWSPYGSTLFDAEMDWDGNLAGKKVISPLMCAYEAAGHFEKGRPEDGLELIRRCWGTMLRKGAETFWEFAWNDADSRWPISAHAWSSGPAYLLPAYILGIRPQKPGFSEVIIKPQTAGLAWAEGKVPTPAGLITVKYDKVSSKKYRYAVSIPEGIKSVEFILSKSTFVLKKPGRYVFESSGNQIKCLFLNGPGKFENTAKNHCLLKDYGKITI
ncbi:MAG: alpha-L-rhamnosidase C-terminal domain-containing protein [Candidatus Omnitrophota bacterium]